MAQDPWPQAAALLVTWFGAPGAPDYDQPRELWFRADSDFDELLRARFLTDQQRAAAGDYDTWTEESMLCLALVLLLDQLPRNLYRGTAQAFTSDPKARSVAREALVRGFDHALSPVRRGFLYLPFEHSEALADQELSVSLFDSLADERDDPELRRYAERHHEIIARFGRFPHRNRALGRVSTPAEEAFLQEPGSSF